MTLYQRTATIWNSTTFGDACGLDQGGILMSEIPQLRSLTRSSSSHALFPLAFAS